MIRTSFNKDWTVTEVMPFLHARPGGRAVTLPYDDLLTRPRRADAPSAHDKAYYPDAQCAMVKRFDVPEDWRDRHVVLEFEGIQTDSTVFVNGDYAGGSPHGYTGFTIHINPMLKYGQTNEIQVIARTARDSRWYTGLGLYREVSLMISGLQHLVPNGHRITTPEIDEEGAVVMVSSELENTHHNRQIVLVETQILEAGGAVVAVGTEPVTLNPGTCQILRQRLYLETPRLWDADSPYLYTCVTTVIREDAELDRAQSSLGVRQLQLDVKHGLRVNGKTVKLRGACVHHDNGVIGSAAIARAEERRVELLKKAGFNAVRSAHNPISRAFLEACDKHGLYVMDELTDVWTRGKTIQDYSTAFPLHWEQAVEAMVGKDFNHPSVIMYSIGNEISEVGSPTGAILGRKIAEAFKSLDPARYTINSVSLILAAMDKLPKPSGKQPVEINTAMTNLEDLMERIRLSDFPVVITQEAFASVDIAGYNYATDRYITDRERFPNRVLCGSETFPKKIAENWAVICASSHVIGDFTWTGWDYLGEAAVGRVRYADKGEFDIYGKYPWYIAYCGDLDITGDRRPVSYYREIVFGLRTEPYIAVWYPETHGLAVATGKWDFMDGISAWTWTGHEGKPVTVEIYAPGDRVELLCNGKKIGEAVPVEFMAVIETVYEPGMLEAVAYKNGQELGRTRLTTAGSQLRLSVEADRTDIRADDKDLAYLSISLTDENGILNNMADRTVTVEVSGAGILAGLGSAKPDSEESFLAGRFTTFNGRALAVIRPCETGEITVTVTAEGCEPAVVSLTAAQN